MKGKDIFTIVVVVIVSAVFSIIISGKLISTPKNRSQSVEVVSKINPNFDNPNPKYFNSQSIDPTQLIQIGPGNTPAPFNSSSGH